MKRRNSTIKALCIVWLLFSIGVMLPSVYGQSVVEKIETVEQKTSLKEHLLTINGKEITDSIIDWIIQLITALISIIQQVQQIVSSIMTVINLVTYLITAIPELIRMITDFITLLFQGPNPSL